MIGRLNSGSVRATPTRRIVHGCLGGYGGNDPFLAVIDARWLYVQTLARNDHDSVTFEELYDKRTDPYEMTNLVESADHADLLLDLRNELATHRAGVLKR